MSQSLDLAPTLKRLAELREAVNVKTKDVAEKQQVVDEATEKLDAAKADLAREKAHMQIELRATVNALEVQYGQE